MRSESLSSIKSDLPTTFKRCNLLTVMVLDSSALLFTRPSFTKSRTSNLMPTARIPDDETKDPLSFTSFAPNTCDQFATLLCLNVIHGITKSVTAWHCYRMAKIMAFSCAQW